MRRDLEEGSPKDSAESGFGGAVGEVTERTALLARGITTVIGGGAGAVLGGRLPIKDETVTTYDPEQLTGWRALFTLSGTIFSVRAMWQILGIQLSLMGLIALLLFRYIGDPHQYQTETMSVVVKTISVLIGFMLGLFLSSSLNRWWDTVKSVQLLFGVIKKLVMLASSLEIKDEQRGTLGRRGLLSVRMLETELTRPTAKEFDQRFDELQSAEQITQEERDVLSSVPLDQRSFFTWVLISNYLKQYHNMLDPISYDRIVTLVLDGLSAVSALRTLLHFQFPFIYMHMLAFMVHMANFLTAIGTGITLGLLYARERQSQFLAKDDKLSGLPDPSAVINEVLFFLVQAFFYQAFLSIGAALSFPISSRSSKQAYRLPFEQMVDALEQQLGIMNNLEGGRLAGEFTQQRSPGSRPSSDLGSATSSALRRSAA
jgi:hypothetical protein